MVAAAASVPPQAKTAPHSSALNCVRTRRTVSRSFMSAMLPHDLYSLQHRSGISMADPRLKQKLAAGRFIVAPGVFDMISTMLAERVGFDAVYASGYWLTASYLGLPDAGIATYTEMLSRVAKSSRNRRRP